MNRRSTRQWAALVVAIALGTGGCASSAGRFAAADLNGAVYDEQGQPVPEACVTIGPNTAYTDINGRFLLGRTAWGPHDVTVSSPGHETITRSVCFTSRSQVVYVRLRSASLLRELAEGALESGDPDSAVALARLAVEAEPTASARFLLALALYAAGDRAGTLAELAEVIESGVASERVASFASLLTEPQEEVQ